jgi:uncharacterized protein (DUF305 family)
MLALRRLPVPWLVLFSGAASLATVSIAKAPSAEDTFLAQMHASMTRMDAGMSAAPTGDIDADFIAMMVPHHQAAIDMAMLQLRYGKNRQLARVAQEIIVEQQQEIDVMRRALAGNP